MFNLDDLFAEPNEFRVCDKCKATNLNTLLPRLKAIDPKAKIYQGCQSYCFSRYATGKRVLPNDGYSICF